MLRQDADGLVTYRFESLLAEGGQMGHAVFTRLGGVSQPPFATLNVGTKVGDDEAAVAENHTRIFSHLGLNAGRVATAQQVHGNRVGLVNTGLNQPSGYQSSVQAIDFQDAWNYGVHRLLLTVRSTTFPPLESSCEGWFGVPKPDVWHLEEMQDGDIMIVEHDATYGDRLLLRNNIRFCTGTLFLLAGILVTSYLLRRHYG